MYNDKKLTHRIHMSNLMESKPTKYLLLECLSNINQYILVFAVTLAIINKKRCVAPINL